MAIPVTPKPEFPNVPLALGVPALPRQSPVVNAQNNIVLLAGDAASIVRLFLGPQWGLFRDGAPAFESIPGINAIFVGGVVSALAGLLGAASLSVGQVEYRIDHRISTAPQEEGAFLSYNKVSMPFQAKVTYILGGIAPARGAFLTAVQSMQDSLTLLSLVMPEKTYPPCNVIHHDFRRSARNGVTMLAVDVWVEEVRVTGTTAFSDTAAPGGADPVNGGAVQPQAATTGQTPTTGVTGDPDALVPVYGPDGKWIGVRDPSFPAPTP